ASRIVLFRPDYDEMFEREHDASKFPQRPLILGDSWISSTPAMKLSRQLLSAGAFRAIASLVSAFHVVMSALLTFLFPEWYEQSKRYRSERHYMRGPGRSGAPSTACRPDYGRPMRALSHPITMA